MKSAIGCRDFDRLVSAYVDHEASPDEMRLVEAHVRDCERCAGRLQRMHRLAPRLDLQLQAVLSQGERASRSVRLPPERMLEFEKGLSRPLLSRLSTVAIVLVFGLLVWAVLSRSAPAQQPLQTAAQPVVASGPYVGVSVDGLVDPPTAEYIGRVVNDAQQEHATLLVSLSPSAGLDQSVGTIATELETSGVPTYALVSKYNSTSATLAAATNGIFTSVPPGASVRWQQMDLRESLWHRVLDPTTAYIFFVLGLYAVFVEIAHPGALIPGITGAVSMLIAAVAFSTLPTNWVSVCMLIAGVGLIAVELKAGKHGLLLLGGLICLGFGSVSLYMPPAAANVVVAPVVLIGVVLCGVVLGVVLIGLSRRIHRLPPINTLEQLMGARGVARTGLNPDGVVHVNGQMWSAHARGGPVLAGEPVRVLARRGLILDVESASYRAAATQKGAFS